MRRGNRQIKKTTQQGALCSVPLTRFHSVDQVKKTEMSRTCSTCGERTVAYRVLVGKPEGRRLLERLRHNWEDNIKMDHRKVE
jgi:hypothetical protein